MPLGAPTWHILPTLTFERGHPGQQAGATPSARRMRVLDLSRMVAGGIAGMLLADFGADVVKVEQPGSGDPLRQWTADGEPLWWKVYARNKRFITLNLKAAGGPRAAAAACCREFDVLMESFVPGTLERLGLGWDVLRALHPRLILAADFRLGADRARQRPARVRHARRGGQRLRRDERRARRRRRSCRAFRSPTACRPVRQQRRSCSRSTTATCTAAPGRSSTCRCSSRCSRCSGRCRPSTPRSARVRTRDGSRRERRSARLLPHERRPLDRRQRLDAEDGRALPAQLRARRPARGSAVCHQRGARRARARARRRGARGDRRRARWPRTSPSSTATS